MKKALLVLLILLNCHLGIAQQIYSPKAPKGMEFVPSKTSGITIQGFFMGDEITNKQYREFVSYLKQHPNDSLCTIEAVRIGGLEAYKKNCVKNADALKDIIDTTVMNDKFKHYFNNPVYDNYPVVGVSYNNTALYCAWKTKTDSKKGDDVTLLYRLPTAIEWDYAASFSDSLHSTNNQLQPAISGKPNKVGLYNLGGNVSEWTSDKKTKGKAWKAPNDRVELSGKTKTDYIGFRIIVTYLGREK